MNVELRFIYKGDVPVKNNNFNNYTKYWSGATITTSADIFPNLNNTDTTQTIPLISGWTFDNGYMRSDVGATDYIYQTIDTIETETGKTYNVYFQVSGMPENNGNYITPYLYGNAGTPVYTSGVYKQAIKISQTGTTIQFNPTSGFTGGFTNVYITPLTSSYLPIDLYDEKDQFNLTFQIATSIADKGATYSKTIRLPGSANNNKTFSMLLDESVFQDLTAISTTGAVFLNKKIDAGIYQDTVELITGYFELTVVIKQDLGKIEYEGTFYSTSKNLAATLGDKLLIGNAPTYPTYEQNYDLDFSEYNHQFNWANIHGSWTNNNYKNSVGYYYPLIDYANISSGNIYRVENFKPSIYVKQVWDKIFEKAGFSYQSNFINSDFFKHLVIPQGNQTREWDLAFNNSRFQIGREGDFYGIHYLNMMAPVWEDIRFNTSSPTGLHPSCFDNGNNFQVTGSTDNPYEDNCPPANAWTVQSSGAWEMCLHHRYDISYEGLAGPTTNINKSGNLLKVFHRVVRRRAGQDFTLMESEYWHRIPAGDYPVTDGKLSLLGPEIWSSSAYTWYGDLNVEEEFLYTGDQIFSQMALDIRGFIRASGSNLRMVTRETDETNGLTPITEFHNTPIKKNFYFPLSRVYVNDCLPGQTKQIDFIKSIANKFNLTFAESKDNSRCLIIEPFDDFYYTGYTNYVDWTSKMDIARDKTIERIPYLLDKDISFNLKPDSSDINLKEYSDLVSEEFGDKLVKNIYYSEGEEKIDDIFSSSMTGKLGDTTYLVPKIFSEQDEYTGWPTDSNYNTRFLYREFLQDSAFPQLIIEAYNPLYQGSGTTEDGGANMNPGNPGQPAATGNTMIHQVLTSHPYAGFQDNPYRPTIDLNYGVAYYYTSQYNTANNLTWIYWRKKIAMYMDINSKLVTAYFRLNPTDIATLDWRKKILVDGNYYWLNKIQDWNPDQWCKVELLQLSNLDPSVYYSSDSWNVSGGEVDGTGLPGTGNGTGTGTDTPRGSGAVKSTRQNRVINLQSPMPSLYYELNNVNNSGYTTDTTLFTGYTYVDKRNYFPKDANGIVIGESNNISNNTFIVQGTSNVVLSNNSSVLSGDNNVIRQNNTTLIGSKGNDIGVSNTILIGSNSNYSYYPYTTGGTVTDTGDTKTSILINSHNNTINDSKAVLLSSSDNKFATGITDGFLILTTGKTITTNNKVYIKDKDWDEMADKTYVYNATTGITITINNNTDDYVLTATGTGNTISGESKLKFNSSLILGASFSPTLTTITATNTKLNDTHHTVIVSGVTTITLQAAASFPNRIYYIKKIGAGNMTLNTDIGSDRIYVTSTENGTSYTISTDGVAVIVQSDGISRWYVLAYTDRSTPP